MTTEETARKLIAALEGVKSDLAGVTMSMEDYAMIANKITTVVGAAESAIAGGPAYCIDYTPEPR